MITITKIVMTMIIGHDYHDNDCHNYHGDDDWSHHITKIIMMVIMIGHDDKNLSRGINGDRDMFWRLFCLCTSTRLQPLDFERVNDATIYNEKKLS